MMFPVIGVYICVGVIVTYSMLVITKYANVRIGVISLAILLWPIIPIFHMFSALELLIAGTKGFISRETFDLVDPAFWSKRK
jgi:hypothetical protein